MFYLKSIFAILAILKIAATLPLAEEIEPVDLAHNCIKVEAGEESQSKTPILLIHGLGASKKHWIGTDLLLADSTKRRVCTVDLRNHGDSPWNNRSDIAALAVDIGHFLDTQNIKKVNIIGHSLGGKVAVHYTLNNPDRVDSLIVEDFRPNSMTKDANDGVRGNFLILKSALKYIPEGLTEDLARKYITDFVNEQRKKIGVKPVNPKQFASLLEIKLVDGKWRYKFNIDLAEKATILTDKFMTISTGLYEGPVLFIYGTESPFRVWDDKDNILSLFPKAQMVPVLGASHFIHGEFPREFGDAAIRFLKEVN